LAIRGLARGGVDRRRRRCLRGGRLRNHRRDHAPGRLPGVGVRARRVPVHGARRRLALRRACALPRADDAGGPRRPADGDRRRRSLGTEPAPGAARDARREGRRLSRRRPAPAPAPPARRSGLRKPPRHRPHARRRQAGRGAGDDPARVRGTPRRGRPGVRCRRGAVPVRPPGDGPRPGRRPRGELRVVTRLDRLSRAIPLAIAFLWLVILYGWQTRGHVTPWLFTDELKLAQISRSISDTGHAELRHHPTSFDTLYAYLLAPFWKIGDVATAYATIKYVGVVVMTSAIFPTYFLARTILSKPWALFAAIGAVAAPALAYAPFLVEEPAAYPWSALTVFLIAKALALRTRWWIVGAGAACIVAPFVRGELAVLIPVYALAALFLLWTSEPARRRRASWSLADWGGAVVLGIGAIVLFSAIVGAHSQTWFIATGFYRHRTIVYGLWAAGAFAIGLGILPVVSLAALVRPRGEVWTREMKAYVALTSAAVIAFGLYTATKASYLSTKFATVVAERNLIYLTPLLFVATGLALERGRLRLWAIAGTAGFVLYVILTTPYNLDLWPYSDALGFS